MTLAQQALAARADGRPMDAADAWRAALRLDPDDWRLALELKQDLRAAYHYPDSDPQFRRAARHLPDAEWRQHYTALYAFHGTDLDALHARSTALLARHPADPALHTLLGDVARQRRDWDAAVHHFDAACAISPTPENCAKQADAHRYQTFAAALAQAPGRGEPYTVLVLSLDRNDERWAELQRQFAGCRAPVLRLAGIEGGRLAPPAVRRLTGQADAPRGTLGCFLSHAAAWQAVVDRNLPHALVVEDDVIPLVGLPGTVGALPLPPDYELCFVNDRLDHATGPVLTAQPLTDVMRLFPPDDNAPGGDGYFISQAGARTLLDWVAGDGFAGDVDWRVVAYGLPPGTALPGYAGQELPRLHATLMPRRPLRAYGMGPALIRTVGVSSDREDQNRLAEGRR